ncbi:hypothetical protein CC2G_005814 [Coprinopsis cinerea AmutBmut pab1-1]|nr:hypothetical protein CC2G_005814 [Coprinopsis cinerea AmutBmut pab1-1]
MSNALRSSSELAAKPDSPIEPGEHKPEPPTSTPDVSSGSKDARRERASSPDSTSNRGFARPLGSPGPSSRFRDTDGRRDRPYNPPPRHTDTYVAPRRGDDRRDYDRSRDYDRDRPRHPLRRWELDRDRDRDPRYGGRYSDYRRDRSPPRRGPPPRRYGGYSPRRRSRSRTRSPRRRSRSPGPRRGPPSRSPPGRGYYSRRPLRSRSPPPFRRRGGSRTPRTRSPIRRRSRSRTRSRSPYRGSRPSPSPARSVRLGNHSIGGSRHVSPRPYEEKRRTVESEGRTKEAIKPIGSPSQLVVQDSDKKPQEPVVNVEATQDAVMKEEEVPQDSPQSPSPPPADDAKMEEDPPTAPQVGEVVAASDPPQKQRSTTPAPAPGPPRPSTTESAATSPSRLSAAETKSPMSPRQDRPSPIPPHVKAEEKLSLRSLKVDHAGLPPIPPPSASHRSPIHFKPTAHSPLATPKYEGQSPRSQHSQQSYQAPAASSHSREEHKRESSTPQSPDVVMADSTPHSQQTHDKSSHPIPPPPQRTGIPTGPRAHGYKDYSIPAGPAATHPRGHPPTGPAAQQPPSGPSNRLPTPQGTKGPNWSGGPGSNRHSSDTMVKTVQDKVDELCGVGRPRVANYPLASEIQTQVETRMLRETKYYETTSIAYPALWELELAMLDLHTSELRRKAASSQLDKAMFGALGIDYVSEGLTLSSSSALQAPPMVASTSTLSTS